MEKLTPITDFHPIRKHAFIIGTDDYRVDANGQKIDIGIKDDMEYWNELLRQPHGGDWKNDEITVIKDAPRDQILKIISYRKNYDFILLYYTGHGCYRNMGRNTPKNQGVTHIFDSDNKTIPATQLIPEECPLSIVFLDCCRKYVGLPMNDEPCTLFSKNEDEQQFFPEKVHESSYDRIIKEQNSLLEYMKGDSSKKSFQRLFISPCNRNKVTHAGFFRGLLKSVITSIFEELEKNPHMFGTPCWSDLLKKKMIESVRLRRKIQSMDIEQKVREEKENNPLLQESQCRAKVMELLNRHNPYPSFRYWLIVNEKPNKKLRRNFKTASLFYRVKPRGN